METLGDIREAVQSDLNADDASTLYPPTTIDKTINRVYQRVTALFNWPQLHDAKYTTTQSGVDYYDAPESWRPQSIWRLDVGGERYGEEPDGSPLAFQDYLIWKDEDPSSDQKRWAMQWLRYFFSPAPTDSVTTITIWGQKTATALTSSSQETIFSVNMPECNEAIALETLAVLKKKGELLQPGQLASQEALAILTVSFNKFTKTTANQEKNQPFFNVPDFFARGNTRSSNIGEFPSQS